MCALSSACHTVRRGSRPAILRCWLLCARLALIFLAARTPRLAAELSSILRLCGRFDLSASICLSLEVRAPGSAGIIRGRGGSGRWGLACSASWKRQPLSRPSPSPLPTLTIFPPAEPRSGGRVVVGPARCAALLSSSMLATLSLKAPSSPRAILCWGLRLEDVAPAI